MFGKGLDLLSNKESSKPRPGFYPASKGVIRKGLSVVIEKHPHKDPIISIILLNRDVQEKCPKDYVEVPCDISTGSFGASVFRICFRTSTVQRAAYEAQVLDRFPVKNHPDYKFPHVITEFCFPQAIKCSAEIPFPKFFSFVFTDESGSRNYGFALQFYEQLSEQQLNILESRKELPKSGKGPLYAPKCAVILSHWPYYEQFKTFLVQLHRIVMSPSFLPFERYLEDLMYSIPVPHPASTFRYRIGHKSLEFSVPPLFNFPMFNLELRQLFQSLDIPSIVSIFEELLLENKLLFYSNHLGVLNPIAESFRALLYPFEWHSVYIPVLPMLLCNAIQAPFPFLVGMHRTFFDEIRVNEDVTLVDLDRNIITYGKKETDSEQILHKILPDKMRQSLIEDLSKYCNIYQRIDFSHDSDDQVSSLHAPVPDEFDEDKVFQPQMIRFTFLKFFISIMENYQQYLNPQKVCSFIPPTKETFKNYAAHNSSNDAFLGDLFVKSCPEDTKSLMSKMISSQFFTQFVQDRVSDDVPFEIIFFDFCIAWYKSDPENFIDRVVQTTSLQDIIPKRNVHNIISVESEMKDVKNSHDRKQQKIQIFF